MKSPVSRASSAASSGYQDYVTGKARRALGLVARGDTLTITLAQPDGAFLANLAGGAACAVPRDTPAVPGGLDAIPSAGPYYIASYSPRQQLILQRNPNYHGDRPHRLDQIVFAIGVDSSRALAEIEAGTADYALDGLPARRGAGAGVAVRPRQQGCEGGTPAVLRQPRARGAMAAHEHEQAAVLQGSGCGAR